MVEAVYTGPALCGSMWTFIAKTSTGLTWLEIELTSLKLYEDLAEERNYVQT